MSELLPRCPLYPHRLCLGSRDAAERLIRLYARRMNDGQRWLVIQCPQCDKFHIVPRTPRAGYR